MTARVDLEALANLCIELRMHHDDGRAAWLRSDDCANVLAAIAELRELRLLRQRVESAPVATVLTDHDDIGTHHMLAATGEDAKALRRLDGKRVALVAMEGETP